MIILQTSYCHHTLIVDFYVSEIYNPAHLLEIQQKESPLVNSYRIRMYITGPLESAYFFFLF